MSDASAVKGIAIEMNELEWKIPSFNVFSPSRFIPKIFPAFSVVKDLQVESNMVVLDMCSSPGGKASHIAAELGNQGLLVCVDKNKAKVERLRQTLSQLGVICARVILVIRRNS